MNNMNQKTLKFALHGLPDRSKKMFIMFLEGPCKKAAVVVPDPKNADVDFFDSDLAESRALLEAHILNGMQKPVIVQSLKGFQHEGVINLKKPVTIDSMMQALAEAKKLIANPALQPPSSTSQAVEQTTPEQKENPTLAPIITSNNEVTLEKSEKLQTNESESSAVSEADVKPANLETAEELDEKNCQILFKSVEDIDLNDISQLHLCSYDPSQFYQGAVESAVSVCQRKKQPHMLHSSWNRIILLPQSGEIWHDCKEEDIKILAGMPINQNQTRQKRLHLTPISPEVAKLEVTKSKGYFQDMDVFLWKLACWTSMGRYPQQINYTKPVNLLNPPDFSRLMLTPHAQRISELLSQEPKTMRDIARKLDISPLFVFLFISAAAAIGLVEQKKGVSHRLMNSLNRIGYPFKATE